MTKVTATPTLQKYYSETYCFENFPCLFESITRSRLARSMCTTLGSLNHSKKLIISQLFTTGIHFLTAFFVCNSQFLTCQNYPSPRDFSVFYDELGIPYSICVDSVTRDDGTVTIRDRDTLDQIRVKIEDLGDLLQKLANKNCRDAFLCFEKIRIEQNDGNV